MQDLDDIAMLLKSLLTLALSEDMGDNEQGELVPSEECHKYVNNVIRGVKDIELDESICEVYDDYDIKTKSTERKTS